MQDPLVAQLVEQGPFKPVVVGSNPTRRTIKISDRKVRNFYFDREQACGGGWPSPRSPRLHFLDRQKMEENTNHQYEHVHG